MADNTTINFMSGSPLNRLGWLRHSAKFINATALSPRAKWLLYQAGNPLIDTQTGSPIELSTSRVQSLLGAQPYFGQGQHEGQSPAVNDNKVKLLEGARLRGPIAVFLGVWERDNGGPSGEDMNITEEIKGDAYFALDVSEVKKEVLDGVHAQLGADGNQVDYASARMAASRFDKQHGAIFAAAKALLEWNSRIKYCASCGSPVYSLWAGWKLACTSLLPWAEPRDPPCPTVSGLHAHQYPRTDCAIITGIIDETGEKMLLGNNKKFPGVFYSTLAGFIEPGETFEEAVYREVYEESGVKVHNVKYHSTQPWPYPGNLMVGFYGRADSTQPINLVDSELADAKWYTRAEILKVLEHPDGTNITGRDSKKLDEIVSGKKPESFASELVTAQDTIKDAPPFRVPPRSSIAGILISDWAYGKSKL